MTSCMHTRKHRCMYIDMRRITCVYVYVYIYVHTYSLATMAQDPSPAEGMPARRAQHGSWASRCWEMGVSKYRRSYLGSLNQGSCLFGFMLGAPGFWKLPNRFRGMVRCWQRCKLQTTSEARHRTQFEHSNLQAMSLGSNHGKPS